MIIRTELKTNDPEMLSGAVYVFTDTGNFIALEKTALLDNDYKVSSYHCMVSGITVIEKDWKALKLYLDTLILNHNVTSNN